MFCVYVDGEQPSKTPPLKFNIHLSPLSTLMAKMKKVGTLKANTTGKVGRLQSKSGQVFFGFQYKDDKGNIGEDPIWLSEELQLLINIEKLQEMEEDEALKAAKKVLVPLIPKLKLGQAPDSDNYIAYQGGDFKWA